MCFHSKQSKDAQAVEKRFKAKIEKVELFKSVEHYNGFSYPKTPVIIDKEQESIKHFQWGLIPSWSKDTTIQKFTLNAKIETLAEKPSFKNSINKRCLIIADGFYEWQWLDKSGKQKQKYLITKPNNELFAFAGIYSNWVDKSTGEIINTYSILTTQANSLMSEIHNTQKRMPVILKTEDELNYLNGTNISDFGFPYEVELIANMI